MALRPGPIEQRIAAELRAELGRQNHSRRWLADQVDQPHNTVSRWILGETYPPLDVLDAMCEALGLSLADLLAAVKRTANTPTVEIPVQPRRRRDDPPPSHRQMPKFWSSWGMAAATHMAAVATL